MNQCKNCGSYAINHNLHGRDGTDPDLCDVCYWRKRADGTHARSGRRTEMNQHQELIISALENLIGDDADCVRAAFRDYTQEQMQEQYEQSGRTCAQLLADYEAYDAKVRMAIDWVKAQNGAEVCLAEEDGVSTY